MPVGGCWTASWPRSRRRGLLKSAGQARTNSTHVLSVAREMCWLEMVAETLRSALNALARAAPDWPADVAEPDWFRHYATRAEDSRFPRTNAKWAEVGQRIGGDGTRLLRAVFAPDVSSRLRDLPEVGILRQVWVQHFHQVEGEVRRRDPKDRPPSAMRLVTPYDVEARGGRKNDLVWDGYKVHLTKTCEPDAVNLVTNVSTTVATVPDNVMSQDIHASPAARACLPGEHWVDAGYPTAGQITAARRKYGIALHGPVQANTSAQTSASDGYGQEAFTIDWDHKQVTCPALRPDWAGAAVGHGEQDPDHGPDGHQPAMGLPSTGRDVRTGTTADSSHVHHEIDLRVRCPALPRQHRHAYAAGFRRGLPTDR